MFQLGCVPAYYLVFQLVSCQVDDDIRGSLTVFVEYMLSNCRNSMPQPVL